MSFRYEVLIMVTLIFCSYNFIKFILEYCVIWKIHYFVTNFIIVVNYLQSEGHLWYQTDHFMKEDFLWGLSKSGLFITEQCLNLKQYILS